jgi:hypothetical protein
MLTRPSLLIPVAALDSAVRFFVEGLGAELKFRDGDRYCALRLHDLEIALVGGSERIVDSSALALRSDSLTSDLETLVQAGSTIIRPVETGPHEKRAVLDSPSGMNLVVSQKL